MFFGKLLLILGLLALTATLIGAGFYASVLTEWFTAWGRCELRCSGTGCLRR